MEIYDKQHHKRTKSKNYFSAKMNIYDKKQAQFTEEDKYEVLDKNLMVNIMGHDDVYDCLNEFMFKEKVNRLNPNVNVSSLEGIDFGRTRYVSSDSNTVFFEKYHKMSMLRL